jgi:uncharacterized membrane protein
MLWLTLASGFFVGIHFGIAGTRVRDALVGRFGLRAYRALFSLASIAGLTWMIWAYAAAPQIETWGQLYSLRSTALLSMLVSFVLVVLGLTTPSPTTAGMEARLDDAEPVRGILRITRHPFLWGVALWAATHLVVNGDARSHVFFGALLLLSLGGPVSIDRKRARVEGQRWAAFAARSSNLPFAAISAGRNRLVLREIGWWRPVLAVSAYLGTLHAHALAFGVSPLPLGM